jgi:uncharacterized protein (TIRG00374 family)
VTPKRWIITILSFALAIGVSVYIIASEWPATGARAFLPPLGHALALGAVGLEILTRTLKIRFSAASLRVPLSFSTTLRTVLGGDFGAAITPSRTGAEPARFLILAEAGTPVPGIILLLWAELFVEMLSLWIVAALLALFFDGYREILWGVAGAYALLVFGLAGIGAVLSRGGRKTHAPEWLARMGLGGKRWRAIQRSLTHLQTSVQALRHARAGYAALSLLSSVIHVGLRLAILPVIVWALRPDVELAPLVMWPLAIFYGGVVFPAPGGGGLMEVAFKLSLGNTIPPTIFGAALIWWRFYSFYLYVILGALATGQTVMRALRNGKKEDDEDTEPLDDGDATLDPAPAAAPPRP